MSLNEITISETDDTNLKVVSFNLLVQCYAGSSQPDDRTCLQDSYRFGLLIKLLEKEIQDGTNIFCFQEVSWEWRNRLVSFFRENTYDFTYDNYGHKYNDYMGVMMAWNSKRFSAVESSVVVGDHLTEPTDLIMPTMSWCELISSKLCRRPKPERIISYEASIKSFKDAARRKNVLQCVQLTNSKGNVVNVMNYHMPCAFYDLEQMRLHIEFVVNLANSKAKSAPVILTGDFNTKPNDETYKGFSSLKNAYVELYGKNPSATNNAKTLRGDRVSEFIGTLDYCFFSDGLTPYYANATDATVQMPNMNWPSDHSMIKFHFSFA